MAPAVAFKVQNVGVMSEVRPDTVRLQHMSWSFGASAALFAALDLEVFTKISEGAATLEEIAAATGMEARNVDRLVAVLRALQLVEGPSDRLRNAPDVERFLVKGKRSYAAPWISFAGKD